MTKGFRWFLGFSGLFFASVIGVAMVSQPDTPVVRQVPAYSGTYGHDVLQRDTMMTQTMSTPGARSAMQDGRTVDAQLQHSHSSAFVSDLEAHMADIDRMLATPRP